MKPRGKRIKNKERLWIFRAELARHYEEFEAKLETLCKEHGVEINCWYSPSKIPQPKFVFGGVAVDADTLYDEEEFSLLFSPNILLDKRQNSTNKPKRKSSSQLKLSDH